jgi:hypothetical protein
MKNDTSGAVRWENHWLAALVFTDIVGFDW